ncbi:hypothetical protein MRB53_008486 [Persea americana]|uniref:Uncharacterized protein n=1 Tax=Persea americana TaxID=3435 RepID=A0ACC2MMY3_PERAE|nr:hypothetical protein MRB53_008486 [Persea americana]
MESKLFLLAILFSSWVFVGFSRQLLVASGAKMVCMQKLIPCQSSLHAPSSPPPPTCCLPLKDMIENDKECLCGIFNNQNLLKSFNVTQEDALKLPKACGADVDITACNHLDNGASAMSPTSNSTTTAPTPSEGGSNSTSSPSNTTSTDEKSVAHGLSPFSRAGVILTSVAASMSIFI